MLRSFSFSAIILLIIFTLRVINLDKQYKLGVFYGLSAYLIWGVLPIYWRQIQHVDAMEILASRFIWSAVFVFILLLATGKLKVFVEETKAIFGNWKRTTIIHNVDTNFIKKQRIIYRINIVSRVD